VGLLPPFFLLQPSFFGLTSDYKAPLLEEMYLCTQYLKGVTYSDVLAMPTYERRFFLSLLTKEAREREEEAERMREEIRNRGKNSKGSRSTRISGDALKTKMKNGEIPNT